MTHRAGYVNIIGNPNVGKSTLMNAWVGERLSIITSKAQTTRHRILGIVNADDYQIVFSDTPGIIKPAYELQASMMDFVKSAFEDADILVYMIEIGETQLNDSQFFERIRHHKQPLLLLINKIDTTDQLTLEAAVAHWAELLPKAKIFPISAKNHFQTQEVFDYLVSQLPESPPYFPKDSLTDKSERFFVNEMIREKVLLQYDKEVPYAVEIDTESFKEFDDIIHIESVIMVERDSQKGILIGHKGEALKKLGTAARKEMEAFFGKKIFLKLYVKVNKDWRSNPNQLKRFGYLNK